MPGWKSGGSTQYKSLIFRCSVNLMPRSLPRGCNLTVLLFTSVNYTTRFLKNSQSESEEFLRVTIFFLKSCIMELETRGMRNMETARIIIVDDNPEIREIIRILLQGEGYDIEEARNGMEALEMLEQGMFDLIILDIMMPGMNGYQTCLEIRKQSNAPILFLSAKGQESDKTLGFSSGGDDYLVKPFSYNELVSRAKALIRRYQIYKGKENSETVSEQVICTGNTQEKQRLHFHDLEIDEEQEAVYAEGRQIELTDTEYAMLHLLIKYRHQIFSAERLYEAVWDEPYYYGANNTIMVHIRNLRKKIEKDAKNPVLIKTIWGKGYRCD